MKIGGTTVLSESTIGALTILDVDNIRIDGNAITSTDTNGAITVTPNGTGAVTLHSVSVSSASAVTGVTSLTVDNINVNGNTIITTDTNGDLSLTPNGTGTIQVPKVNVASGGAYSINAASVLSGTTLGSGVTASSLTSVGTLTALQVDNINVNANTVSSTNTNGDIVFAPNGTGRMTLSTVLNGFLFPVVTTTQKDAISATAGLVVYDTTLSKLCVYTGAAWETITSA